MFVGRWGIRGVGVGPFWFGSPVGLSLGFTAMIPGMQASIGVMRFIFVLRVAARMRDMVHVAVLGCRFVVAVEVVSSWPLPCLSLLAASLVIALPLWSMVVFVPVVGVPVVLCGGESEFVFGFCVLVSML